MKKTVLFLMALIMSAGFAFAASPVIATLPVPGDLNGDPNASDYDAKHPGWSVNGKLDASVKYLVLETNGIGNNAGGFGGIQLANNSPAGWKQSDLISNGWINYTRGNGIVSIAINLQNAISNTNDYATFLQATWAQILIGYYPSTGTAIDGLALTNAYFTSDFPEPSDAVALTGGTDFGFIFDGSVNDIQGGGAITLTPSSNAPGVHVYDQYGAGDGYSGANIILGDDASVWPWSTAGDDGVAFTPEKDATYRMTFNVTSVPTKPADITTGSQGFRVRWLKDDTNGSYTKADARVVNDIAPWNVPFTADQIPAIIPAYFKNTNAGNETQTYSIDIIMDGTQLADSLIGNIAIRGGGGSNAFVINTLVITDADGNQLVNYDKTATGIVPVKPDVTNVYNIDGGIIVNANNEKVSIYAIDGRLVKQTIAGQGTIISLQQGLYIVKVGAAKAVKVVVK